ncbi:MAG TPA: ABC transporter ATP-binding protein [Thermoplasmata archaeon]|nr:ABC transporter ATP-binding protein [Thermoplasmata archaeon]
MSSEALLTVRRLRAAWGETEVLHGIDLDVGPSEYLALLGPNGSGKTTLLRCLAGFERPRDGAIAIAGRSLSEVPPHRRGIGILFQEPALFPRRTVWENIAFGPQIARWDDRTTESAVEEVVDLLGLRALTERRPEAISGGERQRVALARTLAVRPALVLLDEPFASLDPEVRSELRADFRHTLAQRGVAAIHVTHDRDEGLFLGDRVALLFEGRLEQVGTPSQVYDHPATPRAAGFLGYNVVEGLGTPIAVPRNGVVLDAKGSGRPATVLATGREGASLLIVLRLSTGERIEALGPGEEPSPPIGSEVGVRFEGGLPLARPPGDGPDRPTTQRSS